jgi:hypothetical protein
VFLGAIKTPSITRLSIAILPSAFRIAMKTKTLSISTLDVLWAIGTIFESK